MITNLRNLYKYNLNKNKIKFHMPGNYGGKGLDKKLRKNLAYFETTEIEGMDDYHNPSGIIKNAEIKTAKMLHSDYCIYLANGSTSGVIAGITYMFKEGDKILVDKDCHKSVVSGLIISGAYPIYCEKKYNEDLEMFLPLNYKEIKENIAKEPSLEGVILTSPNYFGIGIKELNQIVELCKRHNLKLILDEAHGSHLYFTSLNKFLGNTCRVPLVVNSTHKNLTGLTQTGVININTQSLDKYDLRKHVSLVTSTSPSYPLLASISYCTEQYYKRGGKILDITTKKANYMKELLNKYKIRYIKGLELGEQYYLDPTKITILFSNSEGASLVYKSLVKHGIFPEMVTNNKIIFFLNKEIKMKQLKKAVAIIARFYHQERHGEKGKLKLFDCNFKLVQALSPREAFFSDKERVNYQDSVARVAKEAITPYPPGIPLVFPGQVITKDVVKYLSNNSSSVHGVINGMIEVVKLKERANCKVNS